jgi:cell division protein FtsN
MKPLLLSILLCAFLAGCTGSESVQQAAESAPDTLKAVPSVKAAEPAPVPPERKEQGFVTHSDTIEVQVVSQKRDTIRQQAPVPAPAETKMPPVVRKNHFALQIGAFQQEANAARTAEIFKKRFDKSINQFFDPSVKMYRILVGSFATKEEAAVFQAQLKKEFPKEYSESWVLEVKE